MNTTDLRRERLFQALGALGPYLPHLVIVGGWVPTLYREYGELRWEGRLSFTDELDVLAVPPIPPNPSGTLETALREAGYVPVASRGPFAHWLNEGTGSEIEFLAPATGTARSLGATAAIGGHGDVGCISLADAEIMGEFRNSIRIPLRGRDGRLGSMTVAVPSLGAYMVNKASTYPARRRLQSGPNPKRAKDLLYLRDVADGGQPVRERVERDLKEIKATGKPNTFRMEKARNNLSMTCHGTLAPDALDDAATMLAERERLDEAAARANIVGNLMDLEELMNRALGE